MPGFDDLPEPEILMPIDPLSVNPDRPLDVRADRPGIYVNPPDATDEEWRHHAYQSMQIDTFLVQVRYLFRTSMHPHSDQSYPHLKGIAMAFRPGLQRRVSTGDVMAIHQLGEIDHFFHLRGVAS